METSIVFADISRTIEPLTVNATPHPSCQPNQLPFLALLGGMEFSVHAASFALRELAKRNHNDWVGLIAAIRYKCIQKGTPQTSRIAAIGTKRAFAAAAPRSVFMKYPAKNSPFAGDANVRDLAELVCCVRDVGSVVQIA